MSEEPLTITLFSGLRIQTAEKALTHFRTRKIAALLGTLAYYENRAFPREELIEIIWPDCNPESGRNRLRIALCGLRQDLESATIPDDLLVADRLYVQLDSRRFHTDTTAFMRTLRAADGAADPETERRQLKSAVDLYIGDLLPSHDELWVSGERHRLREAYTQALRKLIRNCANSGLLDQALEYAGRAAEFDPLDEEVHRILMRLYIAMNQPAAALRQYRRMESLLRKELGIGPSNRSRQLAAECQSKSPASPSPTDSQAGKASPQAEADRSSNAPSIAATAVPSTSAAKPPSESPASSVPRFATALPAGLKRERFAALGGTLYGRETAISKLRALVSDAQVRLITLTGPGGIGKTSLALAVAREVQDLFGPAIHFIPLADVSAIEFVIPTICRLLSVSYTTPESALDELAAHFSGLPMLLILDNYEHLAELGADLVQELLTSLQEVTCIVTSRQRLRLAAEHEYVVPPLMLPVADETAEKMAEYASVQMFVERARRVRAGFELTDSNVGDVAAICRRMDGMPLGIELAASWTQLMTPNQIWVKYQDRLVDLTSRLRAIPERHRSLVHVIQTSYDMISAQAQRLFAVLSVFSGTFTLDAIEAVNPHEQLYEVLAELLDHSLLSLREADGDNRFYLLEPLREYAEILLTSEDRFQVSLKHATYYARYVDALDQKLRGPETGTSLQLLDREASNIRAALERFSTHPILGIQLTAGLWRYWYLRGQYREGYEWLEKALGADYEGTLALRTRALRGAGNLALLAADYEAAKARFEEALSLQRESNDMRSVAATLSSLGSIAGEQGDDARAIQLHEESLAIFRPLGDRRGMALTLGNLAEAYARSGELETACGIHEESIELLRDLGAVDSLVIAYNNLAVAQLRRGDTSSARRTLDNCLQVIRQIGNRVDLARCVESYAELAVRRGEMERAAMLFGQGARLHREMRVKRKLNNYRNYEADLEQTRQTLGEVAFNAAWQRGEAMSDDVAAQHIGGVL
jgi:predicted ATPase/DNA-binding SARP family transcriptional activator